MCPETNAVDKVSRGGRSSSQTVLGIAQNLYNKMGVSITKDSIEASRQDQIFKRTLIDLVLQKASEIEGKELAPNSPVSAKVVAAFDKAIPSLKGELLKKRGPNEGGGLVINGVTYAVNIESPMYKSIYGIIEQKSLSGKRTDAIIPPQVNYVYTVNSQNFNMVRFSQVIGNEQQTKICTPLVSDPRFVSTMTSIAKEDPSAFTFMYSTLNERLRTNSMLSFKPDPSKDTVYILQVRLVNGREMIAFLVSDGKAPPQQRSIPADPDNVFRQALGVLQNNYSNAKADVLFMNQLIGSGKVNTTVKSQKVVYPENAGTISDYKDKNYSLEKQRSIIEQIGRGAGKPLMPIPNLQKHLIYLLANNDQWGFRFAMNMLKNRAESAGTMAAQLDLSIAYTMYQACAKQQKKPVSDIAAEILEGYAKSLAQFEKLKAKDTYQTMIRGYQPLNTLSTVILDRTQDLLKGSYMFGKKGVLHSEIAENMEVLMAMCEKNDQVSMVLLETYFRLRIRSVQEFISPDGLNRFVVRPEKRGELSGLVVVVQTPGPKGEIKEEKYPAGELPSSFAPEVREVVKNMCAQFEQNMKVALEDHREMLRVLGLLRKPSAIATKADMIKPSGALSFEKQTAIIEHIDRASDVAIDAEGMIQCKPMPQLKLYAQYFVAHKDVTSLRVLQNVLFTRIYTLNQMLADAPNAKVKASVKAALSTAESNHKLFNDIAQSLIANGKK